MPCYQGVFCWDLELCLNALGAFILELLECSGPVGVSQPHLALLVSGDGVIRIKDGQGEAETCKLPDRLTPWFSSEQT